MKQIIRKQDTNIMKKLFNSKIIFSCGLIFLSNIGYSQSSFKDMNGNTLKVGDRVEIPEDKGTTFTFKSGDLIDQYLVGERIIIADLKGTVNKLKSDGYIIVKLDRQNVRIFMGSNRKDYIKELGPFEVNMDPQWFRMLQNQQPPSNQNSSQPSDEAIAKVAQNLIMYEKSREIASKVNKQIALSICPNTAKDGVWTILNMEDKGNYTVIDVKNQWTGAACGFCDWETYYTKEKIFVNKPNYDIFKIENYYKSANVSKVWSTSDVLAAFAAVGMSAIIISSDGATKTSNSTASNNTSSTSKPSVRSGERVKGGVEIVSWSSRNGFLTAGNNDVRVRLRNKNIYDVIVRIELLNNSGVWEKNYKDIYIRAGGIVDVETLGRAWEESKDIGIYSVE